MKKARSAASSADRDALRRRAVILGLLLVLAALPLLLLAPGEPGAIRGGGVGLAWWYGGVAGELLGLVIALIGVGSRRAAS